jgi:hypothetical protein
VGSQDRRPTLEQIDAWFRARQAGGTPTRFQGRIPYFLRPGEQTIDQALYLSVLAWPVFETVPLNMLESTDFKIERLLKVRTGGTWRAKRKSATDVEFETPDGVANAYVHANGYAVVRVKWEAKRIQMLRFLEAVAMSLCFQLRLFREVFSYADDIAGRLSVVNLQNVDFEWTSSMVSLEKLGPPASGDLFEFKLAGASDIEDVVVSTAMQVCRDSQFLGFEAQVNGVVAMLKELAPQALACV